MDLAAAAPAALRPAARHRASPGLMETAHAISWYAIMELHRNATQTIHRGLRQRQLLLLVALRPAGRRHACRQLRIKADNSPRRASELVIPVRTRRPSTAAQQACASRDLSSAAVPCHTCRAEHFLAAVVFGPEWQWAGRCMHACSFSMHLLHSDIAWPATGAASVHIDRVGIDPLYVMFAARFETRCPPEVMHVQVDGRCTYNQCVCYMSSPAWQAHGVV